MTRACDHKLANTLPYSFNCIDGNSVAESALDAACAREPCGPDAECTPTPDGGFECLCPVGKTGRVCDQGGFTELLLFQEKIQVFHECENRLVVQQ